jgi:hypothetical protein
LWEVNTLALFSSHGRQSPWRLIYEQQRGSLSQTEVVLAPAPFQGERVPNVACVVRRWAQEVSGLLRCSAESAESVPIFLRNRRLQSCGDEG